MLFRHRSFNVKMVKDPEAVEVEPIDYYELADVITKSVSTCIAVYVGADIVRRVVVYTLTTKF